MQGTNISLYTNLLLHRLLSEFSVPNSRHLSFYLYQNVTSLMYLSLLQDIVDNMIKLTLQISNCQDRLTWQNDNRTKSSSNIVMGLKLERLIWIINWYYTLKVHWHVKIRSLMLEDGNYLCFLCTNVLGSRQVILLVQCYLFVRTLFVSVWH